MYTINTDKNNATMLRQKVCSFGPSQNTVTFPFGLYRKPYLWY